MSVAKVRTPRGAWVHAALQALAAGGPDAVRVETLAVSLGVSKGGFYWHFADRQALLEEMLDTWEKTGTEDIIARRASRRALQVTQVQQGGAQPAEIAGRDGFGAVITVQFQAVGEEARRLLVAGRVHLDGAEHEEGLGAAAGIAQGGVQAQRLGREHPGPLPVLVEGDSIGRYPPDTETTVYFCTVEALQNIVKYAGASQAAIRLACPDGSLQFTITDDGAGFDTTQARHGSGLQGMADRLAALGGTLDIHSQPGHGTTLSCQLAQDLVARIERRALSCRIQGARRVVASSAGRAASVSAETSHAIAPGVSAETRAYARDRASRSGQGLGSWCASLCM